MSWMPECLNQLAGLREYGYRPGQPSAVEPAAIAALALLAHDRRAEARRPLDWLTRALDLPGPQPEQAGYRQHQPAWAASWALLAWTLANELGVAGALDRQEAMDRARQTLLGLQGLPGKDSRHVVGHDHQIIAWPWVTGTHSWVEPTALAVLALKTAGWGDSGRAQEGVRMLLDRLLPEGGANYGNTVVLGQVLRAHLQPSGMALTALVREPHDPRIDVTVGYVHDHLHEARTAPSLAWSLMGLAAHERWPTAAAQQLSQIAGTPSVAGYGAFHLGLLLMAATGRANPWLYRLRHARPIRIVTPASRTSPASSPPLPSR